MKEENGILKTLFKVDSYIQKMSFFVNYILEDR